MHVRPKSYFGKLDDHFDRKDVENKHTLWSQWVDMIERFFMMDELPIEDRSPILIQDLGLIKWHRKDMPAARFQDTVHLLVAYIGISYMFEYIGGEYKVELVIGKG
jgi:hypothetical protein